MGDRGHNRHGPKGRPRSRRHCVRWGPTLFSPKLVEPLSPIFCTCLLCQTAGWIKMALVVEVGLGPGHTVLCGDLALLSQKGAEPPPQFSAHFLWPNGWMHQDATWYGGRPQPRRLCVRWGRSPPSQKRGGAPRPIFGLCLQAKRLDGPGYHLVRRYASA